jgi:long-chain fatty acid transport protein
MKTLALLMVSSTATAGGLAVGEQNAVSAGTGGAGEARTDDPGAAWHDPAALADGGGWRVGLSLALARPALEARGVAASGGTAWTATNDAAWSTPFHVDASFARDRWAAGVAVGVPFGGGVTWPAMWPGASEAIATQLMVLRAAPFVAYSFGPLRISAGVHGDAARLQLERGLDFIDTQGDVKIDLAGHGAGVDAAAFWQPRADVGVGVTYRSRTTIAFSGPANFTAPDAFSGKTPDQDAHTSMTLPDQLVLGGTWRSGAFTALADAEYTLWHVNRSTVIAFTDPNTPAATQVNAWHDTVTVRAGGEWRHDQLTARAGAYVDPSPVPAEHLVPASPDASRVGLTAGASWRFTHEWSADVFGEQMWLVRRDTTSTDTMPASYGGTAVVLGAGVRYSR